MIAVAFGVANYPNRRMAHCHPDSGARWRTISQAAKSCRTACNADGVLREVLRQHDGLTNDGQGHRFDDRVIYRLQAAFKPARRPVFPFSVFALAGDERPHTNSFGFATQVMGGVLVAATLTTICLLPALSFHSPVASHAHASLGHVAAPRNEPPIPLEALLETPSPRAALLWGAPIRARFHHSSPAARPAAPRPALETPPLRDGGRHSRLLSTNVLG